MEIAKFVSVIYLMAALATFVPISIIDPLKMFVDGVGKDVLENDTPEAVVMALKHLSFVYGTLMIMVAMSIVYVVFAHNKHCAAMAFLIVFWAIDVYIHAALPWPDVTNSNTISVFGQEYPSVFSTIAIIVCMGLVGIFGSTGNSRNIKEL